MTHTIRRTIMLALSTSLVLPPPVWPAAAPQAAKPRTLAGRAAAAPVAAAVPIFGGDAQAGRLKSEAERCQECHGADGQGAGHPNGPEGKFAKLAGQHPAYILKQIRDFRSGARKHDFMQMMARSLDDADVADIAAYFGSLPPMHGEGRDRPRGQALYERGDAARGIPACVACHGPQGRGRQVDGRPDGLMPVIGGQEWRYLEKQLQDWRSGFRRNSADGAMSQAIQALDDADIQALADYLSEQR